MKKFTLTDRLLLLGYNVYKYKTDSLGILRVYSTSPLSGNGGINYFDNKDQLETFCNQVEENRRIEAEFNGTVILLDYLEDNK